jgi:restriction system protein
MEAGDFVVLPLKTTSQLAIGEITGDYEYRSGEPDAERRHVRPVRWVRTDVPRTSVKQDLLYSLGAFSTYCEVRRNEAAVRIAAIARRGIDPGTEHRFGQDPLTHKDDVADTDDSPVDLETFAHDRIIAVIQQEFAGHSMQELVAAILRCQGFTCRISPEGTDGGIDILAGSGPLGMDEPRLVVQVKSEQSAVGDPVVTQLLGSVSKHTPAQGLLVAWGGVTAAARRTVLDNYFRVRVWDSTELLKQILANYPKLPEEIHADLPLKQIWIAVEETS